MSQCESESSEGRPDGQHTKGDYIVTCISAKSGPLSYILIVALIRMIFVDSIFCSTNEVYQIYEVNIEN